MYKMNNGCQSQSIEPINVAHDLPPAVCESDLLRHFEQWLKIIQFHEIANIFLWPMSDRLFRLPEFVDFLKAEHQLDVLLVDMNMIGSSINDFNYYLQTVQNQSKNLIFPRAEDFLKPGKDLLLTQLIQAKQSGRFDALLFFWESSPLELRQNNLCHTCPTLWQNQFIYPLYDLKNGLQFCRHLLAKFQLKVKLSECQKLALFAGNHTWILSEIFRQLKFNQVKDFEDIFHSETLIWKTSVIWQSLHPTQQKAIQALMTNSDDVAEAVLIELKKLGLMQKIFPYQIPEFLYRFVKQQLRDQLIVTADRLMINQVDLTLKFTKQERLLLACLVQHSKQIVSRDQLAKAIWQNHWEDQYSSWAIDQAIARLRRKLADYHLPLTLITKRGQGYECQLV